MQKEIQNPQFNQNLTVAWQDLMHSHGIHPKYGILIPPDHVIESFNYKQLEQFFDGIEKKTLTLAQVQQFVEQLPTISINFPKNQKQHDTYSDMMILHDLMAHIVQVQWKRYRQQHPDYKQNKQLAPMRVKQKIAIPLHKASDYVKIKLGMTVSLPFLWKSLNDNYLQAPDSFSLQDFKLRRYYTITPQDQQMERLFFGGSMIGTYYLTKINHQIFDLNAIILKNENIPDEAVTKRLKRMAKLFEKIVSQNRKLLNKNVFSSDAFYYRLRPFVQGYKDVQFQFQEGITKISQDGASGGNDPLFQLFQKGVGIIYDQDYQNMQHTLSKGMSHRNVSLIEYMHNKSKVRQYCMRNSVLSEEYNKILQQFVYFLSMHKVFITRNIIDKLPQQIKKVEKGTGGVKMSTLAERYKIIQSLLLPTDKE